ncbi:ABC transporter ATP-binding protein [Xanthobacter autotrophicus]|uniref:ABC transporter ATP-binding protein n=1 Tax=Xanthobacter autotrophicus TaxID=280 RepID=UPI00372BD8BE
MSAQPLLAVKGIDAFYGTSQALFGLDLEVRAGQVMALIGRNGAGKSTTMRTLMGLLPAAAGEISLAGRPLSGAAPYIAARRGLGYVPEDRQIFTAHTVEENLEIAEKPGTDGRRLWTIQGVYDLFPILRERRHGAAGRLSGGEQQMLAIARTLMGNPDILLLDEPSEGLAPIIVDQIAEVVLSFRRAGLTVLLAEQNMHFCLRVATDVTVISKGSAVFRGDVETFRVNDDVKRHHLTA